MLAALALVLANAQATEPPSIDAAPIPALEDATAQIAEIDTAMFWSVFEGCDAAKVREHITDDLRMVHDLGGIVADSGDAFAEIIVQQCAHRAHLAAFGSNSPSCV